MYREFTLFLLAALLLYPGNANAKFVTDSSALANETVLNSNISASDIPVELGLIVPWNAVTDPPVFSAGGKLPKWADCDGRSIAGSDLCLERGICATPDYTDKFLRASKTNIGANYQDSLRSHNHEQPEHTHEWRGELASTAVSGIAKGQNYVDWQTGIFAPGESGPAGTIYYSTYQIVRDTNTSWGGGGGGGHHASPAPSHSHQVSVTPIRTGAKGSERYAKDSDLSNAKVVNGKVNGSNAMSGGDPTFYTSMYGAATSSSQSQNLNTETAPVHIRTRYVMRINR